MPVAHLLTPAQRDALNQWLRALGRGLTHDGERVTTLAATGHQPRVTIERDMHFGGLYAHCGNASLRLDK